MTDIRSAAEQALATMLHARIFIGSREQMHPDGRMLYDEDVEALRAALAAPVSAPGVVEQLGPYATTIADDDDAFMPVRVLRGGCVYIAQGGHQVTMTPDVARRLAAALTDAEPSGVAGEDMVLVPRVPTETMRKAGLQVVLRYDDAVDAWTAMLDAYIAASSAQGDAS